MRSLLQHVATILLTVLIGGFLGASLVRFSPGFGVDEAELDPRRTANSIAAIRQERGVDENIAAFYFHYVERMAHGDLGISRTLNRPVAELIRERLPETMKSVALGLVVGWTFGFAFAALVATLRSWPVDVSASTIAGSLLCVPTGVFALLFVLMRAPGRFVVALIIFPKVFRYARNLLVHSAELPHVLTARAKGLSEIRIFFWHILPSVGPQLLALAGVSASLAFAAAIPVEVLCDLPGIGQLAWKAALGRDLYLLVNLTLVVTVMTLIANTAAGIVKPRRSEA